MTTPKYLPNEFVGHFNVDLPRSVPSASEWPDDADLARARAAYLQNRVAMAVRATLKKTNRRQESLAEDLGWTGARLSRLLTGNLVLSMEDAMRLLDSCGLSWSRILMSTDDPQQRALAEFEVIRAYVAKQKAIVEERIAGIEQAL